MNVSKVERAHFDIQRFPNQWIMSFISATKFVIFFAASINAQKVEQDHSVRFFKILLCSQEIFR